MNVESRGGYQRPEGHVYIRGAMGPERVNALLFPRAGV